MSSQLQNKLLHYEVPPPPEVWNRIAASLDENTSTISEKLIQFEETPPAEVWEKINAQLDQSSKTKVLPFHVRYRRPLKYSGAIAIFVVVAMVVSLLISKKTESEGKNDPPFTVSKDNNIQNEAGKSLKDTNRNSNSTAKTSTTKSVSPETNEIVTTSLPSDKYIILNDANGNAVRLPKKLYTAFVCPTNNEDCKERLKKLRAKFAASAITPDFTGILEILKSLQENQ